MRFAFPAAALLGAALLSSACKQSSLASSNGVPELALATGSPGTLTQTASSGKELDYTLDFGSVQIGNTLTANLTLQNTGASDYQLVAVTGPSDPEFIQSGLVDGTDVAAVGIPITVSFKPFTAASKTDQIVLTTDSASTPTIVIALSGLGVKLDIAVVPPAIDFGNVVVNTVATSQIQVTNNGPLAATLAPFTLIGNDASLFSIVGYDATQSRPLAANGGVQVIGVQFAPLIPTSSADTGAFVLQFCQGCTEVTVSLRGTAVSSGLQIAPNPLSFGYVAIGKTVSQPITVTNVANQPIVINQATLNDTTGTFAQGASWPMAPVTLTTGQSAAFDVAFTPSSSIQFQATLDLVTTDSNSNPQVPITGFGGGPLISCQPATVTFGTVPVGIPVTQQVYCTNVGTDVLDANNNPIPAAELQINASGLALSGSPAFTAHLDQPPSGLTAGQTAAIDVTYTPTTSETDQATLTIASNDTTNPTVSTALSGQGVSLPPCSFSLAPDSLSFGQVGQGQSGLLAFQILDTGTTECLISSLHFGPQTDPSFSMPAYPNGLTNLTLGPAGNAQNEPSSLEVQVAFSPTQIGTFLGSVDFTISDPSAPQQSVLLSAVSEPECLFIVPSNVNLGVVGYDTQTSHWCSSSSRTVNLFNTCNYDVTLDQITSSDTNDFQLTGLPTLPFDLAGGAQATFGIEFTPQAVGVDLAAISILTSTSSTPYLVSLQGSAQTNGQETDTFTAPSSTPKLDVVWLMDDDDDQSQANLISQSVPSLFQSATLAGIDFHMAVVTDMTCTDHGQFIPCTGCTVGASPNAQIITSQDANPESELETLVNVPDGTCDDPDEQILDALFEAFQPSLLAGHNGGFLRSDAHLAVIAIDGDAEDDDSPQSLGFYFSFLESLKANPSLVTFSYVNQGLSQMGSVFQRLSQLVQWTGGVEADTSTNAWLQALDGVWTAATATQYTLTNVPIPGTVTLTLNGLAYPPTDSHGLTQWTYDATNNQIVFDPSAVPPPGAVIAVTYSVTCQ